MYDTGLQITAGHPTLAEQNLPMSNQSLIEVGHNAWTQSCPVLTPAMSPSMHHRAWQTIYLSPQTLAIIITIIIIIITIFFSFFIIPPYPHPCPDFSNADLFRKEHKHPVCLLSLAKLAGWGRGS